MNLNQLRKDLIEFDVLFGKVCNEIKAFHYGERGYSKIDYTDWDDRGIYVTFVIPPGCGCCSDDEHGHRIPTSVIEPDGLKEYLDGLQKKKEDRKIEEERKAEAEQKQKELAKTRDEQKTLIRLSKKYPDMIKQATGTLCTEPNCPICDALKGNESENAS